MKNMKSVFAIIFLLSIMIALNACSKSDDETSSGTPAFDTTNLPMTVSGASAVGSFAFDNDGNLLFVAESAAELRSLGRTTGNVTVIATGLAGSDMRGITVTDDDYIYIGSASGRIYRVDPSTGASSLFATISGGGYINCLAVAPSGFGSYEGQIIAASGNGIFALNTSTLASVQITSTPSVSSIVFGSDGTLYAALYASDSVVTVSATGVITTIADTGLNGPDGITLDDARGYLYTTNDGDGFVKRVTIADGTVTNIATSFTFDSGWAPSRIIYDSAGDLLLVLDDTLTITAILM